MNSRLCINLWSYNDIGTGLCSHWSAKAYNLIGNDEALYHLLSHLAESDYTTVEREEFPKNITVEFKNKTINGYVPISKLNDVLDKSIGFYKEYLEKSLPKIFKFSGTLFKDNMAISQKFSNDCLIICTILSENEKGDIRPYTTDENKLWFTKERERMILEDKMRYN